MTGTVLHSDTDLRTWTMKHGRRGEGREGGDWNTDVITISWQGHKPALNLWALIWTFGDQGYSDIVFVIRTKTVSLLSFVLLLIIIIIRWMLAFWSDCILCCCCLLFTSSQTGSTRIRLHMFRRQLCIYRPVWCVHCIAVQFQWRSNTKHTNPRHCLMLDKHEHTLTLGYVFTLLRYMRYG